MNSLPFTNKTDRNNSIFKELRYDNLQSELAKPDRIERNDKTTKSVF